MTDQADEIRRVYHSSETEEHLGCSCSLMFFAAIPLDGISSWLVGHRPSLAPCRAVTITHVCNKTLHPGP